MRFPVAPRLSCARAPDNQGIAIFQEITAAVCEEQKEPVEEARHVEDLKLTDDPDVPDKEEQADDPKVGFRL